MTYTKHSGEQPLGVRTSHETSVCRSTGNSRRYRQRIKQDPIQYQRYREKQRLYQLRHKAKRQKQIEQLTKRFSAGDWSSRVLCLPGCDVFVPLPRKCAILNRMYILWLSLLSITYLTRFLSVGLAVLRDDPPISQALLTVLQQNVVSPLSSSARKTLEMRRYRERLKRDPVRYRRYLDKQNEYARRRQERRMKNMPAANLDLWCPRLLEGLFSNFYAS